MTYFGPEILESNNECFVFYIIAHSHFNNISVKLQIMWFVEEYVFYTLRLQCENQYNEQEKSQILKHHPKQPPRISHHLLSNQYLAF